MHGNQTSTSPLPVQVHDDKWPSTPKTKVLCFDIGTPEKAYQLHGRPPDIDRITLDESCKPNNNKEKPFLTHGRPPDEAFDPKLTTNVNSAGFDIGDEYDKLEAPTSHSLDTSNKTYKVEDLPSRENVEPEEQDNIHHYDDPTYHSPVYGSSECVDSQQKEQNGNGQVDHETDSDEAPGFILGEEDDPDDGSNPDHKATDDWKLLIENNTNRVPWSDTIDSEREDDNSKLFVSGSPKL